MRLKTVVAMLAMMTLTVNAQETTPTMHITLDKAIELALSENPTIKIAEKEIELKEISKSEAWQNLLPTATLDGAIVYNAKVASMKMEAMGVTQEIKMGKDNSNTWNGALYFQYSPLVRLFLRAQQLLYSGFSLSKKGPSSSISIISNSCFLAKLMMSLLGCINKASVVKPSFIFDILSFDVLKLSKEYINLLTFIFKF